MSFRPQQTEKGFWVIWPNKRFYSPQELIDIASDEVNNMHDTTNYRVSDINEAIDVINDTSALTFGNPKL